MTDAAIVNESHVILRRAQVLRRTLREAETEFVAGGSTRVRAASAFPSAAAALAIDVRFFKTALAVVQNDIDQKEYPTFS
jgi:hypothetical protein